MTDKMPKRNFQYVSSIIYNVPIEKYFVEMNWRPWEHHNTLALPEDHQLQRK